MAQRKRAALPAGMKPVRKRIERWRKTREKRTAMPEELWDAAVALAMKHGAYSTAQGLTINYERLKARLDRQSPKKRRAAKSGRSAGFVELDGTRLAGASGAVVELSRADGTKLTIRMPAGEVLDVAGLATVFWSRSA